jgi:ATP-dependent DNA helicase RecG
MKLDTPLTVLPGIGSTYSAKLGRLGLLSIRDLIWHFPFRYEDLRKIKKIAEAQAGEVVTIQGSVWEIQNIKTHRGKFLTKAIVNDGTSISVVWFNQPYLTKSIKVGQGISLAGKVSLYNGVLTLTSPDYEIYQRGRHTGRLVAIYPETEGLSSKWLRNKISALLPEVLSQVSETLPVSIITKYNLLPLPEALRLIHLPASQADIELARRRLGFEELFTVNLASAIRKSLWRRNHATPLSLSPDKTQNFISNLSFPLTNAQKRAAAEVLRDLRQEKPMNRLLQGDVGSGKTVVAAIASFVVAANGKRVALMAPTEILAEQHYRTLGELVSSYGVKVSLHTGSKKEAPGNILVGTHALLSQSLTIPNLELVIVDEQHRFGVHQRATLRKKGSSPHLLTMTATPIPRTLALTLYADLDLSVLDELPPGRQRVKTYLVPLEKRNKSYQFIRDKVQAGQQVFIVTPLIEPSENLASVKSAKEEYRKLQEEVFPDLKLGLLHGRLKSSEKETIIQDFRDKKYQILVTTPVVEVGIDIPNASIMVIEGAERFGLAALHQLRGRVGRSSLQSWCLLFTEDAREETRARLRYLETHFQGAELAELDLKTRGPGEIYGLRQSGLPDLRVASLLDTDLTSETRQAAEEYLATKPHLPAPLTSKLEPLLTGEVAPD